MSRSLSFLSDFVFPVLLMICGALGLMVVNFLGLQQRAEANQRKATPERVSSPTAAVRRLTVSFQPGGSALPAGELGRLRRLLSEQVLRRVRSVDIVCWAAPGQDKAALLRGGRVRRLLLEWGAPADRVKAPSVEKAPRGASSNTVKITIWKL